MKRQKVYLIVACVLALLSIFVILNKQGIFSKSKNTKNLTSLFAIKDTATITKIFMADMFGDKVLLSKTDKGWIVDNKKSGDEEKIKTLLQTMLSMRVSQPVSKSVQRSVIERLAISSTKVEVYETKPLFKLFTIPFFKKERLIKTYFMGDATQNSLGSYAILEGFSTPCILYKPGFRGYISPIFSPRVIDWYSPIIFETKLTRIQNFSLIDFENSENNFFVEKSGPRTFNLYDAKKNPILNYDTTLLINMLSEFRVKYFEQFLPNIEKSKKDSILNFNLFKTISITDVEEQTRTMKLYHMIEVGDLYIDNKLVEENYLDYNKDRCYATFNDNIDEIYVIQFFHFDRQIQPLSYYLKK